MKKELQIARILGAEDNVFQGSPAAYERRKRELENKTTNEINAIYRANFPHEKELIILYIF